MKKQSLRPLDGTTVVSLEHAVAAPFCTRQLADLGARVIKVERPGSGDFARGYDQRVQGQSSHFTWINRSKQSLALDLKQDEAMQALLQLLEGADVLVQNLAPGAAARMGLSYAALRERFPRLIVCDISGYGADGPYRDKKAYDLLIQSEAGFLSVTGTPEVPSKAGISVADIAAGMYAYTNILSALLLRGRTGEGSHIDVSMLEALGEWMGYPMYYAFDGAPPPPRTGASHASIYPYGPFEAGDGGTVMLGLQNEREWKLFCEQVLLQPALATDARFDSNARRNANREELLRGRTGEGSHIDVSMLEALGEWMGYPMYYAFDGAPPPPRTGASHASIYPYGPFEAGDGGTVMLGLQNEREWKLFCEQVLLQPALATDARFDSNARRNANREELRALILGVFNALDAAQVVQRLDAAGIANARVNDMAGLWAHPQLAARQRWCSVDTPAGPVQALLPPGANSAFDYRMEAVPAVGEHSAAILAELGWSAERIQALCPQSGKPTP